MPLLRTLRETCPDKITCPALHVGPDGDLFVQGYVVTDQAIHAQLDLPPEETVVRIPAAATALLLPELALERASA